MTRLEDVWPLFGLQISTPRLTLNPVRDEQLPGMIDAVLAGIHDPAVMPFGVPWTDAPRDELIKGTARHQWRQRTTVEPENWTLNLAVCCGGRVIGVQDLSARDLSIQRTVHTGSWLTQAEQGKGLGTEMRSAVLQFAFDYLGAKWAVSDAASWNAASLAVSRNLGYVANGVTRTVVRPGEATTIHHVRLAAEAFARPGWSISVAGFDAARSTLIAT
ncbi:MULTISPECIES: GNAT family N-acetyltransferase [unclassified Arthrobacter]|uniref:GNAT family N-acetyltransferase n=1 Tax=unclassified Arthrobacter TaxID=235627 RepID=UPI0014918A9C|nr:MULTISPECIES: GNAT family N-acetyltransferase [unclassified Arthrobacter]MBE0010463.1 N-acetyltransferase [Arthrobacter sp. AET 35A]NOJ62377.1 GNAT family N-acetyltransferase [Arthrobacter sp. 147(2020)]